MIDHLVEALARSPDDDLGWLALADALEEQGDARGEALRLTTRLRRRPEQAGPQELRLQELSVSGVQPFVIEAVGPGGMQFALVPPGVFRRRKPRSLEYRDIQVGAFWLGVYWVTQAQFRDQMGANPSSGPYHPDRQVSGVTAALALGFCRTLSEVPGEREAGRAYRLPTEDEWDHVFRCEAKWTFQFGGRWEWCRPHDGTARLCLRGGPRNDHPGQNRSEYAPLDAVSFRVAMGPFVPGAVRPILPTVRDLL